MKTTLFLFLLFFSFAIFAQDRVQIYNPSADPRADLQQAINEAQTSDKHVLVQVGGNWCSWCIKLHNFILQNPVLDSIIHADYVTVKINYSRENPNKELMQELEFPHRFGFPVLLILDGNGKRLHTQDTGLLEKDDNYDLENIKRFLLKWNRNAVNPEIY
ncbi:MAG: thioredoxin family protein [Bacteroidales bacterium]|nr:thioredoxin family protein [Bacteroidales bacterium]